MHELFGKNAPVVLLVRCSFQNCRIRPTGEGLGRLENENPASIFMNAYNTSIFEFPPYPTQITRMYICAQNRGFLASLVDIVKRFVQGHRREVPMRGMAETCARVLSARRDTRESAPEVDRVVLFVVLRDWLSTAPIPVELFPSHFRIR